MFQEFSAVLVQCIGVLFLLLVFSVLLFTVLNSRLSRLTKQKRSQHRGGLDRASVHFLASALQSDDPEHVHRLRKFLRAQNQNRMRIQPHR